MNSLRAWISRLLENTLTRRILKNTGYLSTANGVAAGLNMIQGILIARLLGVNDYGILGTITLFISVINKLISFRMGELVIKYIGQYSEEGDNDRAAAVFKASAAVEIAASFLAFGLLVILAPLGSEYFAKDPSYTPLFILYGLTILVNLISESSTGLLQLNDRFRVISALLIFQSGLTLALTIIVYFSHGDLTAVLVVYLIGKTINGFGLSIAALIEAQRQWGKTWLHTRISVLRGTAKEMINFGINTNISSSISLITKDSEILWVSLFRNPTEAGWYRLALSLSNIIQIPVSPLPKATYPEFSREVVNNRWENLRHIMRQGSIIAGGYSFAATIGLLFIGRPLIRLILSLIHI
jgi:O-antigen/teichoic acid export membrane protein